MAESELQAIPAPPNIITALRLGFDAITNQILLILFPIALDVFLWLGPHLQLKKVVDSLVGLLASSTELANAAGGSSALVSLENIRAVGGRINLFAALRSYPVGIPSLMSGRLPVSIPAGSPLLVDVTNPYVIAGVWLGVTLIGLAAGSLYFSLVAQAALSGKISWRKSLAEWPWMTAQVILLTLSLGIMFLVVSIPSSCVISVIAMGGISIGQFGFLLYLGVLFWLAYPLLFSPHGIFSYRHNLYQSVRKSVGLTRLTMPTTSLMFLVILLISQGMDVLWRIPHEDSWLILVGLAGHAFVDTALVAASFVYYRDADRWAQGLLEKLRQAVPEVNRQA